MNWTLKDTRSGGLRLSCGWSARAIAAISISLLGASCDSSPWHTLQAQGAGTPGGEQSADLSDAAPTVRVVSVSVAPGDVWPINQAIDIEFDQPIDFTTVNSNTVRIRNQLGVSALGTFTQPEGPQGRVLRDVVRFQPQCPTVGDISDAGLQPGSAYSVFVFSSPFPGLTVQSTSGGFVTQGVNIPFTTPIGSDPSVLFKDPVLGPPQPVVRGLNGVSLDEAEATYVELGGNAHERVYFENGTLGQIQLPLNLYSDRDSQWALVLVLDQPIDVLSGPSNLDRIALQYFDLVSQSWQGLASTVELSQDCGTAGAEVRLSPIGIVPQGTSLRVLLKQGLEDMTGEATAMDQFNFAVMETERWSMTKAIRPKRWTRFWSSLYWEMLIPTRSKT